MKLEVTEYSQELEPQPPPRPGQRLKVSIELHMFGETIPEDDIAIGMEVQMVPRIFEETEDIKVYYSLEQPGTTWSQAPIDA